MNSLLASAMRRAQVSRRGEITEIVFDGQGALVTFTLTWRMAERWATSRTPSGNLVTDRGKLVARLDTLLVRRGTSIASSDGNVKSLMGLLKAMEQAGLDPSEWQIPNAVKDALEEAEQEAAPKKEEEAEPEAKREWYEHTDPQEPSNPDSAEAGFARQKTGGSRDRTRDGQQRATEPSVRPRRSETNRAAIDRLLNRDG